MITNIGSLLNCKNCLFDQSARNTNTQFRSMPHMQTVNQAYPRSIMQSTSFQLTLFYEATIKAYFISVYCHLSLLTAWSELQSY